MASLFALKGVYQKFLVCLGFGIDTFHGVCHAHFLENVSALIQNGAFLGTWSLMREMEEFQQYDEVIKYVTSKMPNHPSIVNTSIIASVAGMFGDYHSTKRTEGTKLFVNALMAMYWAFELEAEAQRNLYLERLAKTSNYQELSIAITRFQANQLKKREWTHLPF